jgi:hypothetical protein
MRLNLSYTDHATSELIFGQKANIENFPPSDHESVSLLQLSRSSNINALHVRSLLQLPEIRLRQRHALVLQACQALVVSLEKPAVDDTTDSSDGSQGDNNAHGRVVVGC